MASSSRHQAAAIGQSVAQAAEQTRDAMSEAVEQGRQHAGETYERARQRAGETYGRMKERAGDLYGQASEHMHDWADRGVHQIRVVRSVARRHTLATTLIAFGLGFIAARLFFRRT